MACSVGCRGFALSDDCFCGWELFENIVISFFMVLSTKIYSFNRLEISFIYFCLKGREPERESCFSPLFVPQVFTQWPSKRLESRSSPGLPREPPSAAQQGEP